uniref:Spatacsin C-terminal domain-containing protein n=1 Tax=Anopheles farauti TaxID=69004 RepID=A0A182Q242_9DIPT
MSGTPTALGDGSSIPPEKSIVLKGWEKLDDDVIIKEVSTKGKHVNLCIQYLAERNELSLKEAKNYFLQKVNAYVYRLLSNRQLYKAHHILKNIDRVPRYVFYQIAAETSDHGLRDYIREHLTRTVENYTNGEEERIAASWRAYTQLKANVRQMAEVLSEVTAGYTVLEIETMSFNTFCMKEDIYRNSVAVDLFFKNQETEISPILDRYTVWSYLLKNNIANLVKIWIQLNSCIRRCLHAGTDPTPHLQRIKIDIYDDPRFNERLRQLFQRWEIDDFMLSQLSHHRSLSRNEIILHELARLGKFVDHERTDAIVILRRLFTTESFKQHSSGWTDAQWFREQITRTLIDNRFFPLLGLKIVSRELLERIASSADEQCHAEVNVFLQMQKLRADGDAPNDARELLSVSRTVSAYILQHNRAFYEENPLVYLFEYGLDDGNDRFEEDSPVLRKLPHLQNFITRLKTARSGGSTDEGREQTVKKLLAIAGVPDPCRVKQFLFHGTRTDANGAVEEEDERAAQLELLEQHGTIPHFNHPLLVAKYGQQVELRYTHYIRLHRTCQAVLEFYREQLQNYSQISTRQINSAAQTVAQMAIDAYWDTELAAQAVAFIEMIGVSSVPTRAHLRCLALATEETEAGAEYAPVNLTVAALLQRCEKAIHDKSLDDPELLIDLEAMTIVAKANGLPYPEAYLKERLLARNDWYRFLLLVDYLNYPREQIVELCRVGFEEQRIGRNLMTALLHQPRPVGETTRADVLSATSSSITSSKRRSSLTLRRRRRASSTTVDSSGHSSISSDADGASIGRSTSGIEHTASTSLPLPAATDISTSSTCALYDGASFLSERYDTDLVSTVLLCSNEPNPYATGDPSQPQPSFDFESFKKFVLQTTTTPGTAQRHPCTFQNLLDRAIRTRWPLLALLAGDVCPEASEARRYCWIVWAMLAGEYPYREKLLAEEKPSAVRPQHERSFVCGLVEHLVRSGRLCTLASSLAVFYPDSGWHHLACYLSVTDDVLFDADRAAQLLTAFLAHSAAAGEECFLLRIPKYEMFNFCARLLMIHLDRRASMHHQLLLLQSYVRCDFRCFLVPGLDFERMLRMCEIVRHTGVPIDFLALHQCSGTAGSREQQQRLYETLCEQLVAKKCHEAAIAVADEAGLPRDSIIFEHWVSGFETSGSVGAFERYRTESARYGLGPELRISFFTHIANRLEYGDRQRYDLLRCALDLIREHNLYPSETFDRDRLEYELALSYIRCTDARPESLELYCSPYWCQTTAQQTQHPTTATAAILYHTFLELKEVAGIDDLTLSNVPLAQTEERLRLDALINRLLDCGDIVQALRYQAIFEQRPLDLHFIVFCMALAEGLVSLYNLSKEERMLLNEDSARSTGRFQRRTLRISRVSQSSQIGGSPMKSGGQTTTQLDSSDTSTTATSDFEELPSRERQDIFEAISALGNRIIHGQDIAQRVILTYRVAMYLDREYNELLKLRDPLAFLPEVVREDCAHKLEVISDIVNATRMSTESFTDFLASEIVSAVVRSKFYLIQQLQQQPQTKPDRIADELLWGYNIDREFHLFLELAPSPTALGNALLRYCNTFRLYRKRREASGGDGGQSIDRGVQEALESFATIPAIRMSTTATADLVNHLDAILQGQVLSLKKQNTIIVALLIKAHDCFVHACSMEGIMEVLACCKALTVTLTAAKSWNLVVRLLVGIGRYRDMYYCFETLINHEQFESLLGQFDDRAANGRRLQSAIITFLNEHCPERRDYFRLAALHFRMYREIAELWETEAQGTIDALIKTYEIKRAVPGKVGTSTSTYDHRLQATSTVQFELTMAMDAVTHATENYLLDNNLTLAQRAAANAELIALQIFFLRQALGTSEKGDSGGAGASGTSSTNSNTAPAPTCLSVLNIRPPCDDGRRGGCAIAGQEITTNVATGTLLYYVNYLLTVPQAIIVGRAYGIEINWPGAIYQHYIIQGEANYLDDYLERLPLTDGMIETLVKLFQLEPQLTPRMEQAIATFIDRIQSVTLKYRLASLLGLKKTIHGLINGGAVYYLKDTNYGKNDVVMNVCAGGGGSSGSSSIAGANSVSGAGGTVSMTNSIVGSSSITSNTISSS